MYFVIKPEAQCNTLLQQIAFVVRSIDKLHTSFIVFKEILTVMTQTKSNKFDLV